MPKPAQYLDPPKPLSPGDGDPVQTIPRLSWQKVNGAKSYRVIIATRKDDLPEDPSAIRGGPSVVFDDTTTQAFETPVPLVPGTIYYWEVKGRGQVYGRWSQIRSFLVQAPTTTEPLPAKTPTGWYYPLKNIKVTTPWLAGAPDRPDLPAYQDGKVHLGADLHASKDTPVYAIGDGTVIDEQGPAQDWGEGLHALAILHHTADGRAFVAIYGHIHTNLSPGSPVKAGQEIGTVGLYYYDNSYHLHFGVHPGKDSPVASSKLGRGWGRESTAVYDEGKTNGFVDPLSWIETRSAG